jgi:hypothetical protein
MPLPLPNDPKSLPSGINHVFGTKKTLYNLDTNLLPLRPDDKANMPAYIRNQLNAVERSLHGVKQFVSEVAWIKPSHPDKPWVVWITGKASDLDWTGVQKQFDDIGDHIIPGRVQYILTRLH